MDDYRKYHEEYMQNQNGTTPLETICLIVPAFFEVLVAIIVASVILNILPNPTRLQCVMFHFIIDFFIIIIPLILSVTYLEKYVYLWLTFVIILASAIVTQRMRKDLQIVVKESSPNFRKAFVTNSRATITTISIIAILAVDFQIFPRRFAKTETFGYSLMDVGVGLFIFSNGIVAPEISRKRQTLLKALTSSIPLWLLGLIRLVVTKELDYQAPVAEYGVHWNFFITLAVTKIVSAAILTIFDVNRSLIISIFLLFLHEYLLEIGLASWVLNSTSRDTFLLANREGIVSSLGYVGLYFLSVHLGNLIRNSTSKLTVKLLFSSFIFLTCSFMLERRNGISRRLANASYCLWIMFIGSFMVALFHCGENIVKKLYNASWRHRILVPFIFEAANYNGLGFFLLGNILTGLVNVCIHTLTVKPFLSFLIIVLYMFVTCSILGILFVNNIKLKIW